MAKRITKRVVDALELDSYAWDSDVPGFCVRRQRRAAVYLLKVRSGGRQRWLTIGPHGAPWTPESARKDARRLLGELAAGRDPAVAREASRHKPTIADLCDRFLREYAAEHKKPSSRASDARNVRNHLLPTLGKLHVADVTRADVDRVQRAIREGRTAPKIQRVQRGAGVIRGGAGVANRCLALLSKMFNLAERWGWRPGGSNPCRHIDKYDERARDRFLSSAELARLGDALASVEADGRDNPHALAALRLLLLTGARRSEILSLRWDQVDFENRLLRLAESKTGAKIIYLAAPALEILSRIPRLDGNPHVIVGGGTAAPLVNVDRTWRKVRALADLPDLRIHDLRHSFASVGAASGLSLPILGKLLGHMQAKTTQRYAHLGADPVREAGDAIAAKIAAAMQPNAGEVLPLVQKRRKR